MPQEKPKNSKNDWRKHKNLRKGGKKSEGHKETTTTSNIVFYLQEGVFQLFDDYTTTASKSR